MVVAVAGDAMENPFARMTDAEVEELARKLPGPEASCPDTTGALYQALEERLGTEKFTEIYSPSPRPAAPPPPEATASAAA